MFVKAFLLLSAITLLSANRLPATKSQLNGRIINGKAINITKVPYQVSLLLKGKYYCSGAIYSEHIILTAAHCTYASDLKGIKISAPAEILSVRAGTESKVGGQVVDVKSYWCHELYDARYLPFYDIAVLMLSTPLEFSTKVQPIPLTDKLPQTGAKAQVSGWGRTDRNNPIYPEFLQAVNTTIEGCETNGVVLCVINPGKSACDGDSGGPLVSDNKLVGLVSVGYECGSLTIPSYFANIFMFREWIQNIALRTKNGSGL